MVLIGIVEEAGDEIRSVRRGDRVLVPFACDLGSGHPGAQAELVRVPRGANLRKVPEQLSDVCVDAVGMEADVSVRREEQAPNRPDPREGHPHRGRSSARAGERSES